MVQYIKIDDFIREMYKIKKNRAILSDDVMIEYKKNRNKVNKSDNIDTIIQSETVPSKKKISNRHIKYLARKRQDSMNRKNYIRIFNEYWWNIEYCQKCWNNDWNLQIHHINKNHYDNYPLNLIKLCLRCHCEAHKWDKVYKIMCKRLSFINNK